MRKLPTVVILGFPNVGKSTLFNRLLRRKLAIVHRLPGMTRDCVPALGRFNGKPCFLVDTGGFFDAAADPLAEKIKEMAWKEACAADLILLVLDGRRELLPAEQELYVSLKKLGRPLFIVVNKVDTAEIELKAADYFRLTGEATFFVSAEHRRNLDRLEEAIASRLPEGVQAEEIKPIRLAIIGRVNVGKSSLINRLCGQERLIVSELPGTTRDLVETYLFRSGRLFSLVDTAGLRRLARVKDEREKASVVVTRQRISQADVLALVMDVTEFPTRQDLAIARLAFASGKPLVMALNKWDLVLPEERDRVARILRLTVEERMEFVSYAPLLLVSAKTGKGVFSLLDEAAKVLEQAGRRLETHELNVFLEKIKRERPPLWEEGSGIKARYMTQVAAFPPTFVLFVNRRSRLLPAYEKFFLNQLRQTFDLWGTPVKLRIKEG